MNLKEYLKNNIIYLDGGMGTMLQKSGLALGELPERLNVYAPELITDIHSSYFAAGSQIICTNTFGANSLKFAPDELELIIARAVENAKKAREKFGNENRFIALDVGPCGRMLAPYGDLDFEDAVSVFSTTVKLGVKYGADLIFIETMNDSYETKAALLAAKESCSLPVFVSNAYGSDGKLMTGADAAAFGAKFMQRRCAHRLQEIAFGSLTDAERATLAYIAEHDPGTNPSLRDAPRSANDTRLSPPGKGISPPESIHA